LPGGFSKLVLFLLLVAGSELCAGAEDRAQPKNYDEVVRTMLRTAQRPGHISEGEWALVLQRYQAYMARNLEVVFYGKVVDQNMMPVSDAIVSGFVSSYNPMMLADYKTEKENVYPSWSSRADSNGVFSVSGYRGYSLDVTNIVKQGYMVPEVPFSRSFSYSDPKEPGSVPRTWAELDTPAVVKIWFDDGSRAELVRKQVRIRFPHDEIERRIDLLQGGAASTNDVPFDIGLRVDLTKGEGEKAGFYRWAFTLHAPGGGLAEMTDITPMKAPKDGYVASLGGEFWEKRPWLFGNLYKTYYLRSRDGKLYAAITVDFDGDQDGYTDVIIHSVANPNGSRDLFVPPDLPPPPPR
jgi:hypothetical protein